MGFAIQIWLRINIAHHIKYGGLLAEGPKWRLREAKLVLWMFAVEHCTVWVYLIIFNLWPTQGQSKVVIELVWDIGVSIKLRSNGIIFKWCRLVTSQVNLDLVMDVEEVGDIGVGSVPVQLWSNDMIFKWCRVVTGRCDEWTDARMDVNP